MYSDVNGYVLDCSGYGGGESEYETSIGEKLLSRGDWPLRRISCCSHTKRNANGKKVLSLCTSAELVLVNGLQGDRFFDSKCTRDSDRSRGGGGSVIDFFACSIEIFENLQSLHIDEKSRFSDHNKLLLSWSGQMNSPVIVGGDHGWGAQKFSSQQCVADGPKGWCFRGSLSEAANIRSVEELPWILVFTRLRTYVALGGF